MKMLEFTTTDGKAFYIVPDKIESIRTIKPNIYDIKYTGGIIEVAGDIESIVSKINMALEDK